MTQDLDANQSAVYPHHVTIESLELAKQAGCYICTQIAEEITEEPDPDKLDNTIERPLLWHMHCRRSIKVYVAYGKGFKLRQWMYTAVEASRVPFTSRDDDPSSQENNCHARDFPSTTGSPAVGALAFSWLNRCLQSHNSCRQRQTQHIYPQRLLDVSFESPRLTPVDRLAEPVDFAAMSHCWGLKPFLTLAQDCIPKYEKEGIHPSELPRNILDVIQVCRWLQLRYLWIDSLCIIQSGPKAHTDWAHHVKLMAKIYATATICISTAAAASAHEECFRARDTRPLEPVIVTLNQKPHYLISSRHASKGFRNAPVASRAWVLQERLFSRRILTFGRQQVFWECCETDELNVCETFPNGLICGVKARGPFSLPELPREAAFTSKSTAYTDWVELVETYTQCQLTFPDQDKLAAFSGIAEAVAESVGRPPYIAGFFAPELPIALSWSIIRYNVPQTRPIAKPGIYRAPSWSWAAADVPVRLARWPGSVGRIIYAQLVSHSCIPTSTSNEFGQLLSAEITIRAPLVPFRWEEADEDYHVRFLDPSTGTTTSPYTIYSTHRNSMLFDSVQDCSAQQDDCYLLPVISSLGVEGIMVRLANPPLGSVHDSTSTERQLYTRIGMFCFYDLEFLDAFNPAVTEELTLV
ncbi:hypothetical protein J1614_003849 [Plenodomus biglobosus]|nr:hypothetical protein J1614_003849 [Plenodomus biglobosus]